MLKSFSINSVLSLFTGLIGLLSYLIFIKFESVATLGIWSTIAIVITISQFVEYGITDGITIDIANQSKQESKLSKAINAIFVFVLLGLFLSSLAFILREPFFMLTRLTDYADKNVQNLYNLGCLSIFLSSVLSSFRAILYGFNFHIEVNKNILISRVLQISVMVFFLFNGYTFLSLIFSLLAYQMLMLLLSTFIFSKIIKKEISILKTLSIEGFFSVIKSSKEMFIIKGSQKVFVDEGFKIILSRFFGAESVGAYSTAFSIVQLYRKMIDAGAKIMINVTQTKTNNDIKKGIKNIYIKFCVPLALLAILFSIIFVSYARSVTFFDDFEVVFNFIIPLVIAYSFNIFATPHYYILMGNKDFSTLMSSSIISIIVLYSSSIFYFEKIYNNDMGASVVNEAWPYCVMLVISSSYILIKSYRNLNKI